MFISGGENIHPEEIEHSLLQFPDTERAAVVAVKDPEFGQRPVAFVKSSVSASEHELRKFLEKSLPRFKIPELFLPWPEFAEDGLKPSRNELSQTAQSHYDRLQKIRFEKNNGSFFIQNMTVSMDYEIELHGGANFISFHGLPINDSTSVVFEDLVPNLYSVLGQGESAYYMDDGYWIGSLGNLDLQSAYWAILNDSDILSGKGFPYNLNRIYDLDVGANMVAFPSIGSADITDALPDDIESNVLAIIGEGMAAVQTNDAWYGGLNEFSENKSSKQLNKRKGLIEKTLEELLMMGVEVYTNVTLHTKLYMSEKVGLVCSMNLYEYSMKSNEELGVLISDEESLKELNNYFKELKSNSFKYEPHVEEDFERVMTPDRFGTCIRCGKNDIKQPHHSDVDDLVFKLMNDHYREKEGIGSEEEEDNSTYYLCEDCLPIWKKYGSNVEYQEKFCFVCGVEYETSVKRPFCKDCTYERKWNDDDFKNEVTKNIKEFIDESEKRE